jgi:gamma-glutamyltranspeptidase
LYDGVGDKNLVFLVDVIMGSRGTRHGSSLEERYLARLSSNDTNDTATTNKPTPVPLTVNGKHASGAGEIFTNPDMARALRDLCRDGAKAGFYEVLTGTAIVEAGQKHGGTLTLQDLHHHTSLVQEPICVEYRGIELWQVPPMD